MPREEVAGEGTYDTDVRPSVRRCTWWAGGLGGRATARAGSLDYPRDDPRIRFREQIRLIGQEHHVRRQGEHVFDRDLRVALSVPEQVSTSPAGDEVRHVRIAAAPH